MNSHPSHAHSRFVKVYVALGILLFASIWLFLSAMDRALGKSIVTNRVVSAERLVRSNFSALDVYDTRRVREEFIKSGIIERDQNFDIIRPGKESAESLARVMNPCSRWIGEQTCISETGNAVIFSSSRQPVEKSSNFAIVLTDAKFDRDLGLTPWVIAGIAIITTMFLTVGYGIRAQEKDLLKKIKILSEAVGSVPVLLGMNAATSNDEIEAASSTIEQLSKELQLRQNKITTYRGWLARQTRHEQLKQTLSHSAHDLRAPLEEAADLLRHLPDLQESLTPEALSQTLKSLEGRVRGGLRSLDNALRLTADQAHAQEPFSFNEIVANLNIQFKAHPKSRLAELTIKQLQSGKDAVLLGDATAFQSVLWNILENSTQARRDARILLEPRIAADSLLLTISDNGPGVATDMLEDIFEVFVTTQPSGTGIGLASARRILVSMCGTVHALDSSTGAVFAIKVPAVFTASTSNDAQNIECEVSHV